MSLSRNTYLKVDTDIIKNNVKKIIKKYNNYKYYIGVVKANCYGCDNESLDVTKAIIDGGCNYLAVATLQEAIIIRKKIKDIPILVLGHIDSNFLQEAKDNEITVTIHSLEYAKELAKHKVMELKAHIKIDTGMNRLGIANQEELKQIINICEKNMIKIEGIYTHIYNAEDENDYAKQIQEFEEIIKILDLNKIPIIHISASEALVKYDKPKYVNGCRPGIIIYGFSNDKDLKLESPIKLISEVIQIHTLKAGETVGYNGKYRAEKETKIAVVSIGYADGIIKANEGRFVYIHDKKYRIVGNICMDMLFIEIDDNVRLHDEVYILKDNKHIEEIAKYLNTIPYEILTQLKMVRS